jgi:hypothetical protein
MVLHCSLLLVMFFNVLAKGFASSAEQVEQVGLQPFSFPGKRSLRLAAVCVFFSAGGGRRQRLSASRRPGVLTLVSLTSAVH